MALNFCVFFLRSAKKGFCENFFQKTRPFPSCFLPRFCCCLSYRFFQSVFFFFSGRSPLYRRHEDIFAFIGADLIFWATKAFTYWEQWTIGSAWFGAVRSDNRTCHRKVNPSLKKRLMIVQFYVFFLTFFPSNATVKGKSCVFIAHTILCIVMTRCFQSVLNSKSRGRDCAKWASTSVLIVGQDSAFLSQSV